MDDISKKSKDKKEKEKKEKRKSAKPGSIKNELINKDNTVLAIRFKDLTLEENIDHLRGIAKEFKSLVQISLESCNLQDIPDPLFALKSLKILNLENNEIKVFENPNNYVLDSLEELSLTRNQLSDVCLEAIGRTFKNLKKLSISRNSIKSWRDIEDKSVLLDIGSSLQQMDLSFNYLKTVSHQVQDLLLLKMLNLSDNAFSEFPKQLLYMQSVNTLFLQNNQIWVWLENYRPESAHGLISSLTLLDVSNNRLVASTANEIKHFDALQTLDLSSNKLEQLPMELLKLPTLVELYLHNNMIESTPAEVETQLSLSILSLYGNNCKNSKTKWNSQAKILWANVKTLEVDKDGKYQIATVKIDKKSSRKGNLVDLLSNSQSTPSSPTHGLGVNPVLVRKKSKPELSSSHGDSSSIIFGSTTLTMNSSLSSPQLRSSDPSMGTVRRVNTPPPVPAAPKSLGSLNNRSLIGSAPGSPQHSGGTAENRNRGFTIGSAYNSAPTSPVLAPAVPARRSSTSIKFFGELPSELQRRNSDSDSAESSPSTSRRGSLNSDVDDPRKLQVEYYLEALSKPTLSWIDIAALRSVIHRVSPQWMSVFLSSGGIKHIFEYLLKINTQARLNEDVKEIVLDLLAIIAYFANDHIYEMFEAMEQSVNMGRVLLSLMMLKDAPLLYLYVIKLLGKIVLKAPRGIPTILDGFSAQFAVSPTKNNRMDPLFFYLDGSCSYPQHVQCALEFINTVLHHTEDLKTRMKIRDEFIAVGIVFYLGEWKSRASQDIQPLMRTFHKSFNDDLEELFVQHGREKLVEYFVANRPHFRLDENFVVIVTNTFGFYYLLLSYDTTTTFKRIIIELMKKGFIESEFHYFGLFLPGNVLPDSSPRKSEVPQVMIEPGSWLHGDVSLFQRNIKGPVLFEFKYQPWTLTVQYKTGTKTEDHMVEIDANKQCSELTLALVEQLKGDLSQEWGLYYKHNETEGNSAELAEWRFVKAAEGDGEKFYLPLEDTEPLAKYSSVVTQSNIIELRPKFVDTIIYYEENSATGRLRASDGASRQKEKFRADPQMKVAKLITLAATRTQLGDPKDFSFVTTSVDGSLSWLDGNLTLAQLKPNSRMNLQLLRRFITIQLKTGDKKVTPVKVDSAIPFKQVVESSHFPKLNAPVGQLITYRKVHGKMIEMDINKSLLEHNINEGNRVTVITRQDFEAKLTARRELAKKKINWADVEQDLSKQEDIQFTKQGEELIVEASSLYQLILALVNTKFGDKHYLNPFLGSLSTFMSVEDFLDKLAELFEVPKEKSHLQRRIKLRVCFILGHFIEKYYSPEDAKEINVNKKLENLVRNVVTKDPTIKNETVTRLVITLFELRKESDGQTGDVSPSVSRSNSFKLKRNASTRDIYKVLTAKDFKNMSIIDKVDWTRSELRTNDIAKQLTIRLSNVFSQMKISELLNQAWLKNKDGMVGQMIEMFNKVSSWVTTTVCFEHQLKKRVDLVIKFIKIAKRLRDLNNFHLVTAIISGLNHFAVSRLKWTMARVPKQLIQVLQELEQLMDMQGSFKNYRAELEKLEVPCIPYLGVVMKDLTFIDEGNPDWVKVNNVKLINFAKRRMIYNLIFNSVLRFQQYKYEIEIEEDLQGVINHLPTLEEPIVEEQSLKIEPRNAARVDLR